MKTTAPSPISPPRAAGRAVSKSVFAAALAAGAMVLAILIQAAVPAAAQGLLNTDNQQGGAIEILADDGIEWLRDQRQYIARGNATASRSGVTVRADTLTAHYRGGEDGEKQAIYRLDADGAVVVTSGDTKALGDKAVYHMDDQVAVLVGKDLKMINERAVITAKDSLEYWDAKQLAVARGDATVIENENRLVADILTAHIKPGATGKQEVERIDALGNVHISTKSEIVRGEEGVYEVPKQIATVCGNVKITRGENQLNGDCAVVDLKTGRSRLTGGSGKVKGLILPTQ